METKLEFTSEPLRSALASNIEHRLKTFIVDETSDPLAIFSPNAREASSGGDWYGEHVGKWLVASAKAARRTDDQALLKTIQNVVQLLISWQEPNGYIGTYPKDCIARFTHVGADQTRTWDVWNHAWMINGLIEVGTREALASAARIGDLFLQTFQQGRHLVHQGNHSGLSSLVAIEPLAKLGKATGRADFVAFAKDELKFADQHGLPFLSRQPGTDTSTLGTGKAYQILWCLQGVLELGFVDEVVAIYDEIASNHLTPMGGPWGGIAQHKEVFNVAGYFSPTGIVETCSVTTWIDLSLRLYKVTGNTTYFDQAEQSIMNSLIGAQDENGSDWIYFTFPNGRRNNTYYWACCKSSGQIGLELAAEALLASPDSANHVNVFSSFESDVLEVVFEPKLGYANLKSQTPLDIALILPKWAKVNDACRPTKVRLEPGHEVQIKFSTELQLEHKVHSVDHHGQEVVREEYICLRRGPYVYAATSDHDIRTAPTVRLPKLNPLTVFHEVGELIELRQPGRSPIILEPYFRAGGRHDGAWRNAWLPVAWQ